MRHNKIPQPLGDRVTRAAEAALVEQQHVSPLDVLLGLGWLDGNTMKRWEQERVECLEAVLQVGPQRLAEALDLFRAWALAKELEPQETDYVARTPGRERLRFSRDDDPARERLYRVRFASPDLSERRRERLAEKASRPPELLAIRPTKREWTRHRCGGSGDLLVMEGPGPICLACAGLGDLAFLSAGDALLTRRAKAKSGRYAVVVRFSRARRRYERQGLLVEPAALAQAERELGRPQS